MLRKIISFKGLDHKLSESKIRACANTCQKKLNVAVILSGCGVFDGTETHEAAATVTHLSRKNMQSLFYAPCMYQTDVVNHFTGEKCEANRDVFTESARIARGNIKPLNELTVRDADALVFPGGFGVAKNLSNYATASTSCTVNIDVCRVIRDFHAQKKPMGFMCISGILAARIIPNVRITLGARGTEKGQRPEDWPHSEAIDSAVQMGANVEIKGVCDISIDCDNLVVSTPAFMYRGDFFEIFKGIGKMVDQLEIFLKLCETESS